MVVRIRMTKVGRKNRHMFRIGVFDTRTRREGRPIEALGIYDPMGTMGGEPVKFDLERAKYWLSVGASPTETMTAILKKAGIAVKPAKGAGRTARKRRKAAAKKPAKAGAGKAAPAAKKG